MIVNFFSVFLVFLVILTLAIILYKSNPKKHLVFFFYLSLSFLFFVLSPMNTVLKDNYILFGNDLFYYFPHVFLIYSISIISVFISYYAFYRCTLQNPQITDKEFLSKPIPRIDNAVIFKSFFIIVFLVFLWSKTSDISFLSLFFLSGLFSDVINAEQADFLDGGANHLKLFIDSLLPVVVVSFAFSSKKIFYSLLFFTLVIFLSLGFRFRIIVLGFSILFLYLLRNDFSLKSVKTFLIATLLFVFLMIIQGYLKNFLRDFSLTGSAKTTIVSSDTRSFSDVFFSHTRNHLAFISAYKYLSENEGYVVYDYGETFFIQPFVRFLPSSFFKDNIKPPPKTLNIISDSWQSYEGSRAGEAADYVAEFYLTGGVPVVVIFSFGFGFYLYLISKMLSCSIEYLKVIGCVLCATIFQYFSRGYFPGYLMFLLYLFFGFLFIFLFSLRFSWERK